MPVTTLVDELRKAANELGWRDSSYEDNLYSSLMDQAANEIERSRTVIREIAKIQVVFDPQPGYKRIREILNNEEWLAEPNSGD